jgi:uncharacterized membrane protein
MRIARIWHGLQNSFWFVPTLITLFAAVLSQVTLVIDLSMDWKDAPGLTWIYTGSGKSAGTFLSAITGSMITATSITFSMTLMTLTLTSSQYGSRVLQNFLGRLGSQIVLGIYLATFLFSLLVLRSLGINGDEAEVPHLSVTVATSLVLISIGALIFFIHYIAKSIRADTLIGRVHSDLAATIDRMVPEQTGWESGPRKSAAAEEISQTEPPLTLFRREGMPVCSTEEGYLQVVDTAGLIKLAAEHDLVVILHCRPGHFVIEGQQVATLHPAHVATKEQIQGVCDQLTFGRARTSEQDLLFAILELVEVALRALSPANNDTQTAIRCVDWLGAALRRITRRDLPSPHHFDDNGHLRIVTHPDSLEGFVDAAFDHIRHASAGKPALFIRLLESLTMIVTLARPSVPSEAFRRHADMILSDAQRTIKGVHDRSAIERRYQVFLDAMGSQDGMLIRSKLDV